MSPKIKSLICTLSLITFISTSFAATTPNTAAKPNKIGASKKTSSDTEGTKPSAHTDKSARTDRKDEGNGAIRASFKREFKTAEIVNWDVTNQFTKVTFQMNGSIMFAFYSGTGELMAVTRNILSSQLPMTLAASLKDKYGDYWITDLFEINGDGSNCYYVTLENADRKIVLRSVGLDSWETYDTQRKQRAL
jgi:hypothetical protein